MTATEKINVALRRLFRHPGFWVIVFLAAAAVLCCGTVGMAGAQELPPEGCIVINVGPASVTVQCTFVMPIRIEAPTQTPATPILSPTPTPEVFTPTPTPDYTPVAQPCYLKTDSGGATNVRSEPYGIVITQLPPSTLFGVTGYRLDEDQNMWVRRLLGGYVARWVLVYHSGCEGSDIPGGP